MKKKDTPKDEQLNTDDAISEAKSLLEGVADSDFSVDDILAEYRAPVPRYTPQPERSAQRSNVIAFPGGGVATPDSLKKEHQPPTVQEPERGATQALDEQDEDDGDEEVAESAAPAENVVDFPQEELEGAISTLIKDIGRRADDYADRMFEESDAIDPEEVRRLEELIPGTDVEEEGEEDIRYVRPKREPPPPPPDLSPRELASKYGKGLGGLRLRCIGVFLITAAAMYLLIAQDVGLVIPPQILLDDRYPIWLSTALLGLGMLLCGDFLLTGLGRGVTGKFGMDTLAALACIAGIVDGIQLAENMNRGGELPYAAVNLVALTILLHGTYHKRCAQRLSCRTAAAAKEPYVVTLDESKWSGKDTYCKWSGVPTGFGSQMQMDDGAQRIYRRLCPLLVLGCVALSIQSAGGQWEYLLWNLSATLTAATALGGTLVYGRSSHKLERQLTRSGATLAGWTGIANSRRGNRVLITDGDLFPPGFVVLNGMKVFHNFPVRQVVAYSATLIREAGSGLDKPFHEMLRSQGEIFRKCTDVGHYEGGGISATIRNDRVLVGSAAFMNLMDIPLPPGLNVKQAVFCAINGELAGIFALKYTLSDQVVTAIAALDAHRIAAILATRDFNLTPAMLRQRFKLPTNRMDYPPVGRRRELSEDDVPHSATITALLCREGLPPLVRSLVGGRRLGSATRAGAILCCLSSGLGIFLTAYLTSVQAFHSIAPLNLLIYLVAWLMPIWFLTDWVHRY